ncbi:MAG: hypothetical protein GF381_00495 [Candidatus Pacebacteria bacterium]|nr:hypothetical protein [Candidatus Paceibacterota bacterium]
MSFFKFKLKPYCVKKYFKLFINLNYLFGFGYAFYFFITTPRKGAVLVRRLWAYECWLILSFYGLFIYLFYLEKSALERHRGLGRFLSIQALELTQASSQDLKDYFQNIAARPDQYSFKTHQGITPVSGRIDQPGSVFKTQEKFAGLTLELTFRTLEVDQSDPIKSFVFELIEPGFLNWLNLQGKFAFSQLDRNLTKLSLTIFNRPDNFFARIASTLFYLSPIRIVISRQINREVKFICQQVEGAK